MKNAIYIVVFLTTLSNICFSQITLNTGSFTSFIGCDSLKSTVYNSAYPSFAPITGEYIDMTIVTDSNINILLKHKPDSLCQYADSNYFPIAGFSYLGYVRTTVTSTGMQQIGITIPRAAFDLAYLTGIMYDSLIVDAQNEVFTTPYTKLSFPTSFLSSWSSSIYRELHIQITDVTFSMHYTKGKICKYFTELDSVIGWGQMRVNDEIGNPSSFFNVLQIQSIGFSYDSLKMDTPSFNTECKNILRISDGRKDTVFKHYYYREGMITPLAVVTFTDATFSTPKNAVTHVQMNMNEVAQIPNNKAEIYPNPVTNSEFIIKLPYSAEWKIEITNSIGKSINVDCNTTNNTVYNCTIPNVCRGIYIICCKDKMGNKYYSKLNIIE